jgi:glutamine amidotransferase
MADVVVIDYGMGNILSVKNALECIGATVEMSDEPELIAKSPILILPGVGSFRKAMQNIRRKGIYSAVQSAVKERGARILGICLGMQLFGSVGTEDGVTPGLGFLPNRVDFLCNDKKENLNVKIPHVGFDSVEFRDHSGLFSGFDSKADFYFVHSYRMLVEGFPGRFATCIHGEEFLAAFEMDNICGTQFHPEKSQTNGLLLLRNFLNG